MPGISEAIRASTEMAAQHTANLGRSVAPLPIEAVRLLPFFGRRRMSSVQVDAIASEYGRSYLDTLAALRSQGVVVDDGTLAGAPKGGISAAL